MKKVYSWILNFSNSKMCSGFSYLRAMRTIRFSFFCVCFALSSMNNIKRKAYSQPCLFFSPHCSNLRLFPSQPISNLYPSMLHALEEKSFPSFPIWMWFLIWLSASWFLKNHSDGALIHCTYLLNTYYVCPALHKALKVSRVQEDIQNLWACGTFSLVESTIWQKEQSRQGANLGLSQRTLFFDASV